MRKYYKNEYYVIYAVEMLLKIAIKKYYHQLSNVFKSPIKKNRNELLFILSTFFKIKYNNLINLIASPIKYLKNFPN